MDKATLNKIVYKNKEQYWKGFLTAGIVIFAVLYLFGIVRFI